MLVFGKLFNLKWEKAQVNSCWEGKKNISLYMFKQKTQKQCKDIFPDFQMWFPKLLWDKAV